MEIKLSPAVQQAHAELQRRGRSLFIPISASPHHWANHAELSRIKQWLHELGRNVDEVEVIYWLSTDVLERWKHLPMRAAREHRAVFDRVARLAKELKSAIEETGSYFVGGGGEGLMRASLFALMNEEERAAMISAFRFDETEDQITWLDTPTVEEVLDRLVGAAETLSERGPPHTQPRKRGAQRGYYVRAMHEALMMRYGTCPEEVLASLATVALGDVTDRDLVAKLLR